MVTCLLHLNVHSGKSLHDIWTQFLYSIFNFPTVVEGEKLTNPNSLSPIWLNLSLQGIGIQSFQDSPYLSRTDHVLEKTKCMVTLGQTPPVQSTFLHIKRYADTITCCF